MRTLYLMGLGYVMLSLVLLAAPPRPNAVNLSLPATGTVRGGTGAEWFQAIRPFCNAVEVETRHRWMPPPETADGDAFSAACYALAGRVDRAREIVLRQPDADRWRTVGVVFDVAHPVADAGDDLSAGPIMELVVEFWPNHYMALYHAGMSRYALGQPDRARVHLTAFLEQYHQDDGWRRSAHRVLSEISE